MPLFGGTKREPSIRDVPQWENVLKFLTEKIGEQEVALSKLPLGIFGNSEREILRDKGNHTVVYPSSLNNKWNFRMARFQEESLPKLDVGFAPDGTGAQFVGKGKNFVNRKFVDAFVACMSETYNGQWENMYVWMRIHAPLPIFLVGEPLTMTIAPNLFKEEPTGKYQFTPQSFAGSEAEGLSQPPHYQKKV